ncbi:MAG: ATP-grasp domain-containing protein, partial [Candidatus Pacebacteria bacterium]|nr:ATP-grasp domain-containing protein [Candidatus Paceibacterota bacterium]
MREVLIIGGNHQNPLGVMEALGRKGILSNVIVHAKSKSSFVLKSKYVKKGWICATNEDVVNCIVKNFKEAAEKTVAIACSDNMASLLNDNFDLLSKFFIIPGMPVQGLLSTWMDKEKMSEEAVQIGLNIPQSWLIHKRLIPADVEYPCVTKSLSSVGNGKAEFTLCNNRQELEEFLREKAYNDTIQVQKYIDKAFEFQYLGCSLNGGEEIIIPGRTHIEMTTHFNNITFLRYQESKVIEDSTTLSKTEAFIRHTGYSGLFSVEFMHGLDGKDYFL